MSAKQGFLCEDWNELLIASVQARPALYTKSIPDYSDRNRVHQLWEEVYSEVVPSWEDLSPAEKRYKGNDVKTKWQNLRTCFKRELNEQKKQKLGLISKKRRKYIYYHLLSFLLPTFEESTMSKETKDSSSPKHRYEEVFAEEAEEYYTPPRSNSKKQKKYETIYEEPMVDITGEDRFEEIDEDKYFLLSLVPSFKKMSQDEKIQLKVKFLTLIGDPGLNLIPTIELSPQSPMD